MSKLTLDEAIKYCLEVAEGYEIREKLGGELTRLIDCSQRATENRQIAEWLTELKEAKRLLKSAIDEWNLVCEWGNCGEYCGWFENGKCSQKWSGEAEALKLIES